jgi:hypothetical protein
MKRSSRTGRRVAAATLVVVPLLLAFLAACGGATQAPAASKSKPATISSDKFKNATRCDATKPGRELSYHDLAGRGRPDMVEVLAYAKGTSGASEGHVICMEVDTNRDGVLDLLRTFTDKGDLESEEADRNYDGKSDIWVTYANGVISKQSFDSKFSGVADEFHFYKDGKLKRIERDRNKDTKVDVWEFYVNGRLERMGIDFDFNGRVDAWYRDEVARAEQKKLTGAAAGPVAAGSAAPSVVPAGSAPPKKKAPEAL